MKVLTNYLENDYVQKNCAVKAADWILTPYRNLFNGKDVELIITRNEAPEKWTFAIKTTSYRTSLLEKTLFAIVAIIISPLALIAAIFKHWNLLPPPKISGQIGSHQTPLKQGEPVNLAQILKAFDLPGEITYHYSAQGGAIHVQKYSPSVS